MRHRVGRRGEPEFDALFCKARLQLYCGDFPLGRKPDDEPGAHATCGVCGDGRTSSD